MKWLLLLVTTSSWVGWRVLRAPTWQAVFDPCLPWQNGLLLADNTQPFFGNLQVT
jgi:hypothetical protein